MPASACNVYGLCVFKVIKLMFVSESSAAKRLVVEMPKRLLAESHLLCLCVGWRALAHLTHSEKNDKIE